MFNDLIGTAQRSLSNVGGLVGTLLGNKPQPVVHQTVGLYNRALAALSPAVAKPAIAQQPTIQPKPVVQPRQLPQQPPAPTYTASPMSLPQPANNRLPVAPTYTPPTAAQFGVPSMEASANRYGQDRLQKYAELIAPKEQAISAYLASRRPTSEVYQDQLTAQGIPQKAQVLSALEKDILNQQGQLETLPKEDIARRQDTGMLTEAARNRIQAMEERPIREQLFKTSQLKQNEEVGYNRALDLAGRATDQYGQETQQGLAPLQSNLDSARSQFGVYIDNAAQQLSGFTQDREALLKQYEGAVSQGYQLNQIQEQQKNQLKQQEQQHIQTMQVVSSLTKDVAQGQTLNSVMGKYLAQGLDPDTILSLYNAYSIYGPADKARNPKALESPEDLTRLFGVSTGRFPQAQG